MRAAAICLTGALAATLLGAAELRAAAPAYCGLRAAGCGVLDAAALRSPFYADTLTSAFDAAGVRVIVRRNAANDVVAANLYLLGGNQQYTPDTEGLEAFLLASTERGTRRYPGPKAASRIAELGSEIVVEPRDDWTMFGFRAITSTFDSTWAVWADRLLAPALDSAGVELVRAQLLTGARGFRDSPDALVNFLADSAAFAGTPYAFNAGGTERSLTRITRADLRRYHDTQLVTSRMLLVIVGNVDRARVERLVAATLGTLPRGSYRWAPPAAPASGGDDVVAEPRALPTNYILGRFIGPPASSPDYQALRVATAVLTGRLFTEIRTRRNLTYAVEAPFEERALGSGGLYVTTVQPDTTLALMRAEVARLQNETLDPTGLGRLVQGFITEYFLNTETNAEQASFLARAELYRGDYRAADRFVDELKAVTPDDIRRVAQRYMKNVHWAYVGDPSRVSRARLMAF